MHDMQNKLDQAMQLVQQQEQQEEVKNLTSDHKSNGSIFQDQARKSTLSLELSSFFLESFSL